MRQGGWRLLVPSGSLTETTSLFYTHSGVPPESSFICISPPLAISSTFEHRMSTSNNSRHLNPKLASAFWNKLIVLAVHWRDGFFGYKGHGPSDLQVLFASAHCVVYYISPFSDPPPSR